MPYPAEGVAWSGARIVAKRVIEVMVEASERSCRRSAERPNSAWAPGGRLRLLGAIAPAALLFALGCRAPAPAPGGAPEPPVAPVAPEPELSSSLVELGERALAQGELGTSEQRFRRALGAHPASVSARVGLARVALARGRPDLARPWLEEALALDPEAVEALKQLAGLEAREGEGGRSRSLLEEAIRLQPGRHDLHGALAELIGAAPRDPIAGVEEAVRRANLHSYDPWAALQAARALQRAGRTEQAARRIQGSLWLADLDPASARAALQLLRELEGDRARRVVEVHCFADEALREDPHWRMRLRLLWAGLSKSLDPLLESVFVPVSMKPFSSRSVDDRLAAIQRAFFSSTSLPSTGLVAAFTGREMPRRKGRWRLGQAELLGRQMLVRTGPIDSKQGGRTLAHEVLHLYGGVHVAADLDSLMNPSGESSELDGTNARIVSLLRDRRFGPGGLDANVIPFVELEALTEAYLAALRLNLDFRRLGIDEALEARERSRFIAADMARDATRLDSHLGDVANFVAQLLVRQRQLARAVRFFDFSASLHGHGSPKGRLARKRADELLRLGSPGDGTSR
jgi:tetratricopeptide (TPR) repeat protein